MHFSYRAYDSGGRLVQGEVTAETRESALELLNRRGEIAIELRDEAERTAKPWWAREISLSRPVSGSGLALFTRELATLMKAEVPLDETLRIVSLQPSLPHAMKQVTGGLLSGVLEGQSLSQAMASRGDVFPEYYWRLVRGGEASGALGDVLEDLAGFLERSEELRSRITSALLYPAILLGVAALAIVAIMTVLLPAIVPLLKESGAPLPPVVKILDGLREFIANYHLALLAAAAGTVAGLLALNASGHLRGVISRVLLSLPVTRTLVMRREVSRFARTLATLMKSGVPLLDATRIAGGVLSNRVYRAVALDVAEDLRRGAPLTRTLSASGHFPEVALRLVAVGEKTGQIETMLLRVADIFEAALQGQLSRFAVLLTPILTLVIGLLVGGLIVSVMGALLSVNELAVN